MSVKTTCNPANVILHAFDWKYADIAAQASDIAKLGYGSVLVSPPMKSPLDERWWQRYQPQDYRVIDNALGNTHDFKQMVSALRDSSVNVYVDVVFNHMANEASVRDDLQYPSEDIMNQYQEEPKYQELALFGDLSQPLYTEEDFVEAFGIKDWKDRWEVQNGRISGGPKDPGLPTLSVCENVVEQQKRYLTAMKALGVSGFRIDAAKHMTLEHLKQVWTDDITDGLHIFGEIITDGGASQDEYEIFLEPYLKETKLAAYDFPLFSTISKSFAKKGSFKSLINPYSFGQALSKHRAITFVVTHDIPNNDVFRDLVMKEEDEWLAYAYIFGRDGGVPLVYSDLDTSGIKNKAGSPRWLDAWKHPKMVQMIKFHNHVHGEPMQVVESDDDMLLMSRGDKGFAIINKSRRAQKVTIPGDRRVTDLLSNLEHQLGNDIHIAPKSAMLLI